jgi:hypothetical protein
LTLPTYRYHKNRGSMMSLGAVCNWVPRSWSSGSYLLMSLWRFVCLWPCHMWHACDVGWCQFLVPFIDGGPFPHFLHLSTVLMVRWEALWSGWLFGEWRHHEKSCCAAGCFNLQHRDGLDDLQFLLSNSTFHDFKLCCGSMWILFKSVLKSQNNECFEYNVEQGNSIQKHILRVYIMKYSNLETMNASSMRGSK